MKLYELVPKNTRGHIYEYEANSPEEALDQHLRGKCETPECEQYLRREWQSFWDIDEVEAGFR